MFLLNTLLVIAGLYVYLSLFRQAAVRQNGAAALGDREFGVPEAVAAIVLVGWFAINILAAFPSSRRCSSCAASVSCR